MTSLVNRRVLLVEQDEILRRSTTEVLQAVGFVVTAVGDVREGCRLAAAERPDAALVHVGMGDAQGWSVVRTMREDLATRGCPIVATSGRPIEAFAREPMLAEVEAYLMKPWEPEYLIAVVAGVMGGDGVAARRARGAAQPDR